MKAYYLHSPRAKPWGNKPMRIISPPYFKEEWSEERGARWFLLYFREEKAYNLVTLTTKNKIVDL